jgi:hypothetical protein
MDARGWQARGLQNRLRASEIAALPGRVTSASKDKALVQVSNARPINGGGGESAVDKRQLSTAVTAQTDRSTLKASYRVIFGAT